MNSENDPALDVSSIRFFQTRRVDGMLLSIVSESDGAMLEVLGQVKVPVVLVDREVPGEIRASSVHNDHASGMAEAVRHLLGLGHRHIALIGGSPGTLPGRAREAGLREAIDGGETGVRHDGPAGSFSPEHGVAATRTLLESETAAERHHLRQQPGARRAACGCSTRRASRSGATCRS